MIWVQILPPMWLIKIWESSFKCNHVQASTSIFFLGGGSFPARLVFFPLFVCATLQLRSLNDYERETGKKMTLSITCSIEKVQCPVGLEWQELWTKKAKSVLRVWYQICFDRMLFSLPLAPPPLLTFSWTSPKTTFFIPGLMSPFVTLSFLRRLFFPPPQSLRCESLAVREVLSFKSGLCVSITLSPWWGKIFLANFDA